MAADACRRRQQSHLDDRSLEVLAVEPRRAQPDARLRRRRAACGGPRAISSRGSAWSGGAAGGAPRRPRRRPKLAPAVPAAAPREGELRRTGRGGGTDRTAERMPGPKRKRKRQSRRRTRRAIAGRRRPPRDRRSAMRAPSGRDRARRCELLDNMLNAAGEISIYRARLEQQLSSIDFNLDELGRVVSACGISCASSRSRPRRRSCTATWTGQRRDDFDPLELDRYSSIQQFSRALAETVLATSQRAGPARDQCRDPEAADAAGPHRHRDAGRADAHADGAVPRQVQRLARIVRQAAAETGKLADIGIDGAAANSTARCSSACWRRSSTCCATRSSTASRCRRTRTPPARRRPAPSRSRLRREGTEVVDHGRRRRRGREPRSRPRPRGRRSASRRRSRSCPTSRRCSSSSSPASRPPARSRRPPAAASAWTWSPPR